MDLFNKEQIKELKEQIAGLSKDNARLNAEKDILLSKNNILLTQLEFRNKLKEQLEDTLPTEKIAREKEIANIAGVYVSTLRPKLAHFISQQKEELSKINYAEKMYDLFRSNINCFRILDDWFNDCLNEHIANMEERRAEVGGEGDQLAKTIKDKYDIN